MGVLPTWELSGGLGHLLGLDEVMGAGSMMGLESCLLLLLCEYIVRQCCLQPRIALTRTQMFWTSASRTVEDIGCWRHCLGHLAPQIERVEIARNSSFVPPGSLEYKEHG
jgi:hypothetical protein